MPYFLLPFRTYVYKCYVCVCVRVCMCVRVCACMQTIFLHCPENCRPLQEIQNEQPREVQPGSRVKLLETSQTRCEDEHRNDNVSYILVYQNPNNRTLKQIDQQHHHRVMTPPIYINTSGVYCVYRQCPTAEMDHCCIKVAGKHNCTRTDIYSHLP